MQHYDTMTMETVKPGVKLISFSRPETYNSICDQLADDFLHILRDLYTDRECRVVILRGNGKGFCGGADLTAMTAILEAFNPMEQLWQLQKKVSDIIQAMRAIPQPIIGAISGAAAGGGASFAMACDLRIASTNAKFILSYINVGMTATDMGSSYFLPRLIGMSRATELMLTGRPLLADEGERIGLYTKVVPEERLLDTAMEYADLMLDKSDFGLRLTKELLNLGTDAGSLANQVLVENRNQFMCAATGSFARGINTFQKTKKQNEKRQEELS
ncbi:MAG: enoyl-CoA hydratase/isomerase family protein [Clostridiales bacterium]|nr:enoyl-CoA hydratase/isomerase family protein [Clostridiales bacterium]